MADQIEVGELVIRLIADARQLEQALSKSTQLGDKFSKDTKRGFDSVSKATEGVGRAVDGLRNKLTGLIGAYVGVNAVIASFANALNVTTQLDHLSQVTGVSVQRLGELRGVALQLGIDFDVLRQAITQFAPKMTEALQSSTSRGAQAARALGISLRDANGNLKSFDQILTEVASRFPLYADGANKAAIASAFFGEEAGPRLIPILNGGVGRLDELRRALGRSFTAEDAERARTYRESIARLRIEWEGLVNKIIEMGAGPAATALSLLKRSLEGLQNIPTIVRNTAMNAEMRRLLPVLEQADQRVGEVERDIEALNEEFDRGEIAMQAYTARYMLLKKEWETSRTVLDGLMGRMAELSIRTPWQTTVTPERPQPPPLDPFALERGQFALEKIQERLTGTRSLFDEINFSWKSHSEVVQQALSAIDRAHGENHQRQQARWRLETQLQQRSQQQMLETASLAAQVITQLWPKQKGAAVASAVINTAVGITRALSSLDPPWSFAQAGLIAAAGAAQIATIRSTTESGGSAPSAPSASSAAPDTRQDVNGGGKSLFIQGIDPAGLFTGAQLNDLLAAISDEVKNGRTLIATRNLPI